MAKLKIPKRENGLTVFCFQACVVTNNVFGMDAKLYVVAKLLTLVFFVVVSLRVLQKGKMRLTPALLIPTLFTVYCAATAFWAYNPTLVFNQMITQVQLFMLLLFTFWAMNDGITILDYLKAVYISGFGMAILAIVRYGGLSQYMDNMIEGVRMGGEITNQNTFGLLFGNAALSTVYYFVLQKKRIHIVSFAIFTFFAFSSASRKAMLMILIGIVAVSLIRYGFRKIYKTLLMAVVVLIATIFALRLPYFSGINERLTSFLSGEQTASDRVRQDMISRGLELFRQRPIHGFGLDNFRAMHVAGVYSHNNYIELLSGGGIVALVMYYLMFLQPAASILLVMKKNQKLPDLHLMLLVWLTVEMVFGVAMVQLYNKNSWLLAGVLLAEGSHVASRGVTLQGGTYENH